MRLSSARPAGSRLRPTGASFPSPGIPWSIRARSAPLWLHDHAALLEGFFSWIDLPIIENGRLRYQRGITDIPGPYCLGLTWQWTRGSALMGWVKDDAEFITERIAALQEPRRTRPSQTTGSGRAVADAPELAQASVHRPSELDLGLGRHRAPAVCASSFGAWRCRMTTI
jgi:hypothetical protein